MVRDLTSFFLNARRWRPSRAPAPPTMEPGVVLGESGRGRDIVWPTPSLERAGHAVVLAASGAGKTVMVGSALVRELVAAETLPNEQWPAALVVDPKGDLVAIVLAALAAEAPHRLQDVRYLDPFGQGFAFNLCHLALGDTPLDIRATQLASLVAEVSTASGAARHLGVGARQVDALVHVLLAALDSEHEAASVLWALDALVLNDGFKRLASVTRSQRAKQFLLHARLADELRASTASRLRASFAASDQLERLVTVPSCVQFDDLLAPGRITLIDLGRPTGGLTSLQSFFANVLVRLAVEHLMERPSPWTGHAVRMVVDEAQVVAPVLSDVAERVLTTGRSRGVSLVTLSQGTTLLADASPTLLRVLMTNSPLKLIGRLSAPDAELLAREQAAPPGIDDPVSRVRQRFSSAVTNLEDRSFFALLPGARHRFETRTEPLAEWELASRAGRDTLDAVRARLAVPANQSPRVGLADLEMPGGRRSGGSPRSPRADGSPPRRGPRQRWG